MCANATEVAKVIRESVKNGGKVLICGNGGSLTQADHFAGELMGDGIPCYSLSNSAVITALANDDNFDNVFGVQVLALGKQKDVLICLTTSNQSENIRYATKCGAARGMYVYTVTAGLDPKDPFTCAVPVAPGCTTQYVQEKTLEFLHRLWKEI